MSRGRAVGEILDEIRGALAGRSDDALREVLAYIFKEYVVEGRGLSPKTANLISAKSELDGMSFVELVRWLQLNLDVPELALFEIQGTRVSLKLGAQAIPIESAASRPEPLPSPTAPIPPSPATPQTQTPQTQTQTQTANANANANATPRPAAAAPVATSKPPEPKPAEKDAPDEKDSKRFSLLEVD